MFTYITADDWEGLYLDGKLVTEGHHVTLNDLAEAAGLDFKQREATHQGYAYLADQGDFPEKLSDFEEAEGTYVPYSEAQE